MTKLITSLSDLKEIIKRAEKTKGKKGDHVALVHLNIEINTGADDCYNLFVFHNKHVRCR